MWALRVVRIAALIRAPNRSACWREFLLRTAFPSAHCHRRPSLVRHATAAGGHHVGWHPYRAGWDIQAGWGTRWLGDPESPMFVLCSM